MGPSCHLFIVSPWPAAIRFDSSLLFRHKVFFFYRTDNAAASITEKMLFGEHGVQKKLRCGTVVAIATASVTLVAPKSYL
jgi:hypothetical protein